MMVHKKAKEECPRPLEMWEALAEEFVKGGHTLSPEFKELECCYLSAPTESGRKELESALLQEFHRAKRTALCISGGGVRSATFGLGVIQGLAEAGHKFRRSPADEPKSPLTEFDFLSTVSGGGYVGGWLSAWAARDGGLQSVVNQLAPERTQSDLEPEPDALQHLRKYCRFLNPKMGILSADTWALVSTVIRNMVLNWLVLIPLLMAVLTIPLLYETLVKSYLERWMPFTLWFGAACAVVATAYVGVSIPSLQRDGKRRLLKGTETEFLLLGLLPFTLSALSLTIHWALKEVNYSSGQFVMFGAAVYAAGSLFASVVLLIQRRIRRPWLGVFGILASAFAGACAGLVAYPISQAFMDTDWKHPGLYCCLAVPLVLLTYQVASILAVGATSEISGDDDREWWARSAGWVLIVMIAWVVFCSAVILAPGLMKDAASRIVAAASTAGVGGVASWLGKSAKTLSGLQAPKGPDGKPTTSVKDVIAKLAAPIFLLMLIGFLGMANQSLTQMLHPLFQWLASRQQVGPLIAWLKLPELNEVSCALLYGVALFAVAWVWSRVININRFSLHAMYRSRLVRTYLGASQKNRRANPFIDMDEHDNIDLVELHQPDHPTKPLHIVNMALNLVGGKNLAWQQRKAESFTASALHTGSLRVGYQKTVCYAQHATLPSTANDGAGSFSLGSAIAISGAAASPNMGYHSSPLLSLVMTLFNARLGWWLANPGSAGKGLWQKDGPVNSFMPLINEALGRTDDQSRWVYLSDGGHFENLGVYEMVLRRCHKIVVIDGSQDEKYTFEDLGNAVQKARVDLGVSISFQKMPMHKAFDESNFYCALGKIDYRCVDGAAAPMGEILYIKACLNGSEPIDVRHYASQHSAFPQQGTEELWFDESQFESYRRLGSHIVETIVSSQGGDDGANKDRTALAQLLDAARRYPAGADKAAAAGTT